MPYVSRPMKLVTVWLTEEEKATLDRLAKEEDVTLSKAIREGLKLYFEDAKDWIEERQGDAGRAKPA
jgi:predicted transcriptional regulator